MLLHLISVRFLAVICNYSNKYGDAVLRYGAPGTGLVSHLSSIKVQKWKEWLQLLSQRDFLLLRKLV